MEIESWMVNAFIAAATVVATFAVMKSQIKILSDRVNKQEKEINELKESSNKNTPILANAPNHKYLQETYVSKEVFQQFEKSIDDRLEIIGNNTTMILTAMKAKR